MFSVIFHCEVFFWFCSFRKYTHYDHLNSLSLWCVRDTAHVETLCDSFFSSSLSFVLSSPNFSLSSPYRVLISPSCMIFHGQLTKTIWLSFKWDGHMYPVFLSFTHTHTHTHTHHTHTTHTHTYFTPDFLFCDFLYVIIFYKMQITNWHVLYCRCSEVECRNKLRKNPRHISLNSN